MEAQNLITADANLKAEALNLKAEASVQALFNLLTPYFAGRSSILRFFPFLPFLQKTFLIFRKLNLLFGN